MTRPEVIYLLALADRPETVVNRFRVSWKGMVFGSKIYEKCI